MGSCVVQKQEPTFKQIFIREKSLLGFHCFKNLDHIIEKCKEKSIYRLMTSVKNCNYKQRWTPIWSVNLLIKNLYWNFQTCNRKITSNCWAKVHSYDNITAKPPWPADQYVMTDRSLTRFLIKLMLLSFQHTLLWMVISMARVCFQFAFHLQFWWYFYSYITCYSNV